MTGWQIVAAYALTLLTLTTFMVWRDAPTDQVVILPIQPAQIIYVPVTPPPLPDRNPER